jgi:hypothetical protein
MVNREWMDKVIDSGRTTAVYHMLGCKSPKRDPRDKKCDGCYLHYDRKHSYKIFNEPIPEVLIAEDPEHDSTYGPPIDFGRKQDFSEPRCVAKDYIFVRRTLKKILDEKEKVK